MDIVEREMIYLGSGVVKPYPFTIEDMIVQNLKHRPLNREQMSIITGIPRTTLYDSLVKLIMKDKVETFTNYKNIKGRPGRPKVYYKLVDR